MHRSTSTSAGMSARCLARLAVTLALALPAVASNAAPTAATSTGAGASDPTFGTGGRTTFRPSTVSSMPWGMLARADGKLVMAGTAARSDGNGSFFAARLLQDGSPDPAFGTGGATIVAIDDKDFAATTSLGVDGSGRIYVGGEARSSAPTTCAAIRLLPDGKLDTTFGTAGIARWRIAGTGGTFCYGVTAQPDGKLLMTGYHDTGAAPQGFVVRLGENGQPDPSFNGTGYATLAGASGFFGFGVSVQPDGSILVAGSTDGSKSPATVHKFRADGTPATEFGSGGMYATTLAGSPFSYFEYITTAPDGKIIVSGIAGGHTLVVRLSPGGVPDPGFASGGVLRFTFAPSLDSSRGVLLQPDGKLVLGLTASTAANVSYFGMARLLPDGTFDPGFGSGGTVSPSPSGANEGLTSIALAADGKIWLAGNDYRQTGDHAIVLARLLGDEITTPIVEFRNATLNHYFITADPNEAAAIDSGAAGPGWSRTGQTFRSGGPSKAGRFYGNPATNPATGTRYGPNSHFYSLDATEIAAVKQDIGWHFESYDFNAWPKVGGTCANGTIPVLRAYNNRFAQNDSNHRYMTSQTLYDQMLAQGWSGEGTVFCAQQ